MGLMVRSSSGLQRRRRRARRVAVAVGAHLVFQQPKSGAAHAASVVQEIYERAAQGDLDGAAAAMDLLTADDVGLVAGGTGSKPGSPIGYHHVHADDGLSMGIFVIPAGGEIPLHDHPGMSVLSKLLFGSLRVTAYDMPDAPPPARSLFGRLGGKERTLACAGPPSVRTVSAPCETLRLDPGFTRAHVCLGIPLETNPYLCFTILENIMKIK